MRLYSVVAVLVLFLVTTLAFAAPSVQPPRAQVVVLSNSSPHVSVIDAETNAVIKTGDIPRMTSWTWNTDRNYYDGRNLWLGMRNPNTNDVEVVLLDLDTLQITQRIPLGQETATLYVSKPSRTGTLFVARQNSGQVAVINIKTYSVVKTIDVPVSGGVACDVDVSVAFDGKEHAYVPTRNGNSVVSIDTTTLQILQTLSFPEETQPFMLTTTPDGRRLWVQELAGNANVVLNGLALQLVERIPTGPVPINNTCSPDGKLSFTGHNSPFVVAHSTETFQEVWRSQVGVNAQKLGVHPAGSFVYAIVTSEGALAVLEAATGKVVRRISLGTNPTGIFVRRVQ
jgi:DNA-binding beta-propeller fold protein YncE